METGCLIRKVTSFDWSERLDRPCSPIGQPALVLLGALPSRRNRLVLKRDHVNVTAALPRRFCTIY
ncbi:UNVERIFIED_CONTAM: hypothetical protein FKN15_078340 [Acipenser sinensis]